MSDVAGPPLRVLVVDAGGDDVALIDRMIREESRAEFVLAQSVSSLEMAVPLLDSKDADVLVFSCAGSFPGGDLEKVIGGSFFPALVIETEEGDSPDGSSGPVLWHRVLRAHLTPAMLCHCLRFLVDQARIARELAREKALMDSLLGSTPDLIYFKDPDGRFIGGSASLAKMYGVDSADDLIGRSDRDFVSAERATRILSEERHVMETGQPLVNKLTSRERPDGEVRWNSSTKLPLRDSAGRIVGTFGITRDITDLKRLEEALSEERNLLRSVIDNVPDPIYVKNSEGRYVLGNKAHAEFLGVKGEEEVVGKTVFDFFDSEFANHAHLVDTEVLQGGAAWVNREEKTSVAGQVRWLLTSKMPLRDDRGIVRGLVCINRDITARRLAQEELIAANASLSSALADLKRAHEELRSVQLQLIEAEKLKSIGGLAAGVAHEVKNPLAIISIGLEYLSSQTFTDDSIPLVLHEIGDAVKRADTVIKGLLDFSAPRRLELKEQDLNAIIRRALVLVRGEMKPEKMRLITELGDIPAIPLDRAKISQVFINIMTNAIHAMEGEGTLCVRSRVELVTSVGVRGGDRARVFRVGDSIVVAEVADSGPGIPEDKLAKVFEPFYTTKPTGKGTGLGMSVVKSIIDLHGGTIEIRNRPEGGAMVTISFKT